ncbi:hypothetical protein PBY51_014194 [Eleginops maclovinus]|uniref:Uncharacterized protein n=1 Tax=Eleginops maclovinus TaxID=56733 RepID=A0AAN7ZYI9_ELEMC|nr:hypothetical protein PBY51_014194 [Eleginops maclovinus]
MFPLLVSSLLSAADFPHSARKCPLQYSSRQIRRLPHLNLALGSPRPNPLLHSPQSQPTLSAARGPLGRTQSSASHTNQPPGPGAGEGQIKACLAPSFFSALTSNQPHSGVVSCQASACP